ELHPVTLVDRELIVSGGPPPDGIPSIDEPAFEHVSEVDWLDDGEAVFAVEVDGVSRAYPAQILVWHEIVNDELDGVPVSVTYCPICNSAVAFERALDGRILDFGTSGTLFQGALVMYDRQTESLWTHFDGRAVVGTLVGAELAMVPVQTLTWDDYRTAHPRGQVLSRETGYQRSYGDNPYGSYHDSLSSPPFTYRDVDGRLDPLATVVGLRGGRDQVAVDAEHLEHEGVVDLQLDGRPVTVWHRPGMAFPVGAARVADGDDVGTTPAFYADRFEGPVRFTPVADGFVDSVTGTTWSVLGRGVAGPHEGEQLEPVLVVNTRWFAWSGYHPSTRLVD
ncbi:MAG: DUF3179 domain-containing protein, partial [Nitriliruptoraceae bacterium]